MSPIVLTAILLLQLCLQGSSNEANRRALPNNRQSSKAINWTVPAGKHFGMVVDHLNSDGSSTKQIVMNNNRLLPMVGFGTWQLGNDTTVKRAIRAAISAGYRLIDTAYIYGNEKAIGQVLHEMIAQGKVKRDDVFLTTKVWNNHHSTPKVLQSIRDSLKKLKLKQLDLVLLHFPVGFKEGSDNFPTFANGSIIPRSWRKDAYLESWEAMESAVKMGLTRSIGVSNFNQAQMRKVLAKAKIKPVLNQVESNPNLRQDKLNEYLTANKVLMQAYAPIRLADPDLLQNPTLVRIGKRHGKSPVQIALRWQLERKVPLVVKSSKPSRITSNYDIFDVQLSANEMTQIGSLEQKPRIYTLPGIESHPDYPFNDE